MTFVPPVLWLVVVSGVAALLVVFRILYVWCAGSFGKKPETKLGWRLLQTAIVLGAAIYFMLACFVCAMAFPHVAAKQFAWDAMEQLAAGEMPTLAPTLSPEDEQRIAGYRGDPSVAPREIVTLEDFLVVHRYKVHAEGGSDYHCIVVHPEESPLRFFLPPYRFQVDHIGPYPPARSEETPTGS